MSNSIADELEDILSEYGREVQDAANKTIKNVAKQTVKRLKSTSPRKSGKYASGWTSREEGVGFGGAKTVTVYNQRGQLTHLLENGHVVRNKKGTYGRAPAHPHIKPAEEWAASIIESEFKKELD